MFWQHTRKARAWLIYIFTQPLQLRSSSPYTLFGWFRISYTWKLCTRKSFTLSGIDSSTQCWFSTSFEWCISICAPWSLLSAICTIHDAEICTSEVWSVAVKERWGFPAISTVLFLRKQSGYSCRKWCGSCDVEEDARWSQGDSQQYVSLFRHSVRSLFFRLAVLSIWCWFENVGKCEVR